MERSDSPPSVPAHFGVAFDCGYHGARLVRSERGCRATRDGPGVFQVGPLAPLGFRGDDGASQVPGEPPVHVPRASTPAGSRRPAVLGASMLPSAAVMTSAPARDTFRGSIHAARALAVYASRRRLPDRHARLASGWWPAFAGWEWVPTGFQCEVSECHVIRPPRPGFAWRTTGTVSTWVEVGGPTTRREAPRPPGRHGAAGGSSPP